MCVAKRVNKPRDGAVRSEKTSIVGSVKKPSGCATRNAKGTIRNGSKPGSVETGGESRLHLIASPQRTKPLAGWRAD
jgi:hypothetical protein